MFSRDIRVHPFWQVVKSFSQPWSTGPICAFAALDGRVVTLGTFSEYGIRSSERHRDGFVTSALRSSSPWTAWQREDIPDTARRAIA